MSCSAPGVIAYKWHAKCDTMEYSARVCILVWQNWILHRKVMAAFSCSTFALGMSRARLLQICHCRDCANVYEIFASLNVFTFERVSEVDHPQNPTTQGDTLSLSLWSAMLRGDVWTEWFQFACHLRRHEVLHYQAYYFFIYVYWWKEDIIWPIEARNTECEQVCLRKGSEEWQGCIMQVETCNTNEEI